jgi:hypothetical protein
MFSNKQRYEIDDVDVMHLQKAHSNGATFTKGKGLDSDTIRINYPPSFGFVLKSRDLGRDLCVPENREIRYKSIVNGEDYNNHDDDETNEDDDNINDHDDDNSRWILFKDGDHHNVTTDNVQLCNLETFIDEMYRLTFGRTVLERFKERNNSSKPIIWPVVFEYRSKWMGAIIDEKNGERLKVSRYFNTKESCSTETNKFYNAYMDILDTLKEVRYGDDADEPDEEDIEAEHQRLGENGWLDPNQSFEEFREEYIENNKEDPAVVRYIKDMGSRRYNYDDYLAIEKIRNRNK